MRYDLNNLIILCHGRLEFKMWSRPSSIYLPSSTDLVVTVIILLSMNALIVGNLIPDFVVGVVQTVTLRHAVHDGSAPSQDFFLCFIDADYPSP